MMYRATQDRPLATTITGSLPRPSWFVANLAGRSFLATFARDPVYREQYGDAVAALIADQTRAGLDILSDGEMRFDIDIGGRSWSTYILDRMQGLEQRDPREIVRLERGGTQRRVDMPGDILNESIRMSPLVIGPLSAGKLQYDAVWKTAQRLTDKPVKMGSCSAQHLDQQVPNRFHKDRSESIKAFSRALNEEYHRLADAGCSVIQVEEPCLHNATGTKRELSMDDYVDALNLEVRGLREKTEVWCHTCWGNPFAQRLAQVPSLKAVVPHLDRLNRRRGDIRDPRERVRGNSRNRRRYLEGQEDLHWLCQASQPAGRRSRRCCRFDPQGLEVRAAGAAHPELGLRLRASGHDPHPCVL
jgi:5-methyltetrahydropteroyltriglutamate--homocysteine methyltransferase